MLSCWPRVGWNLKAYRWRHHLFLPPVSVGFQVVLQSKSWHNTNSPYHPLGPHQWLPCRSCYPVKVAEDLRGTQFAVTKNTQLLTCALLWNQRSCPSSSHSCSASQLFPEWVWRKWACLRHGMVFLCFMPFESQLSDPMEQSYLTDTSVTSCLRELPRNQTPARDQIRKHQRCAVPGCTPSLGSFKLSCIVPGFHSKSTYLRWLSIISLMKAESPWAFRGVLITGNGNLMQLSSSKSQNPRWKKGGRSTPWVLIFFRLPLSLAAAASIVAPPAAHNFAMLPD